MGETHLILWYAAGSFLALAAGAVILYLKGLISEKRFYSGNVDLFSPVIGARLERTYGRGGHYYAAKGTFRDRPVTVTLRVSGIFRPSPHMVSLSMDLRKYDDTSFALPCPVTDGERSFIIRFGRLHPGQGDLLRLKPVASLGLLEEELGRMYRAAEMIDKGELVPGSSAGSGMKKMIALFTWVGVSLFTFILMSRSPWSVFGKAWQYILPSAVLFLVSMYFALFKKYD